MVNKDLLKRSCICLLCILMIILSSHSLSAKANPIEPNAFNQVYLPFVTSPIRPKIMLGVYTDGYLGLSTTIENEVKAIENWSGKKISLIGTFIAFEDLYPDYNIPVPLGMIWDSGYIPFVNVETKKKLADINSGGMDNQIRAIARAFRKWHDEGTGKGQDRIALVAPLQEMNGYWVSYRGNPSEFKDAFSRIKNLFRQEGASSSVIWVFAPNGWSSPNDPPFEDYYPGDDAVSVVAFSSYNAGYCPSASWKSWDSPDKVYASYIERFMRMSPSKPIIVAQTGTSAYSANGYDKSAKNKWLQDAYSYLANQTKVVGIIYFNKGVNQSCDWPFFNGSTKFDGYKQGVTREEYLYISPSQLIDLGILP